MAYFPTYFLTKTITYIFLAEYLANFLLVFEETIPNLVEDGHALL